MGFFLLSFIAFLLLGFIGMIALYRPVCEQYKQTLIFKYKMLPFPYIFGLYAVGATAAYFLVNLGDFIEPLTILRALLPLGLALLIYLSSLFISGFVFYLLVIGCVAINIYIQPLGIGNSFANLPLWEIRAALIIIFSVFCLGYKVLSFIPHTIIIPSVITLLGVVILGILEAAPLYEALCAALLIGILLAYLGINFNEVKINLDDGACCALAFLIFGILALNIGEYCLPSCLIFTMIFWAELAVSVWNRYIITRSGRLNENTNYYALSHKVSAHDLTLVIAKIGAVSLIVGWFQLFAVNQYSLLLVSFILVLWLNNTFGMPLGKRQSLKEINHEVADDLKKNLQEAKDVFSSFGKKD